MNIALIQAPIVWDNPIANILYFQDKIMAIEEEVNLFILPEMFSSGFTMEPFISAETMNGETVSWMRSVAMKRKCAITGSIIIFEKEQFYNRMIFAFPSGEIDYYDKKHLFTLAGEDKIYEAGTAKKIIKFMGWKICLQVCYDLRFPVFARNVEDYDLLIYVANWPVTRIAAWDVLLKARAIENMSYVIGVNRIGIDKNKYEYVGHSQAIDELGNFAIEPTEEEGVFVATLDQRKLLKNRKKLKFLADRDDFELKS
jgi:predicted amidohydrolase